ncbi:MAG: lysDH [Gammaproteobacteria bacterium]|jgi:saccharopine dehydrogenase-like NADP-dependent oxidoreductase|nr:lysDH [Gammaproteobacteria bacterium]
MHRVLIVGAGKIGSLIAALLAYSKDYEVFLADININESQAKRLPSETSHLHFLPLDAQNKTTFSKFLRENRMNTLISSLPYYCNIALAKAAKEFNLNYFDLTEDTHVTNVINELACPPTSFFVPQCGLAPGFISIIANHLIQHFSNLDTVKMRVGALPINTSNALHYALTWSTDGLINEYGNVCYALENGKTIELLPLEDLEEIKIDGLTYEAFNTSGGVGSLPITYAGRHIKQLNYKTIRYPGHCEKMRFLMNDLKLNEDRDTLKRILENAIPKTGQDVVLTYVSVIGSQDNQLMEKNYFKKFYSKKLYGLDWSAIQLTTASSLCAVLDIILEQPEKFHGLIRQEQISLEALVKNRFGQYFS